MPLEHRFDHEPSVVFDALVEAVRKLEKYRSADRDKLLVQFSTKMSGWSWGSRWVIQLASEGDNTLANAAMQAAGSLVAGMTEKKRIEAIWAVAQATLDESVASGVIAPPPPRSTTAEVLAAKHATDDALRELYGTLLADERFGGAKVQVFSKGFIRIGKLGNAGGTYQRLLRIEENFVIQQKTGVGRLAAGVVTGGLNILVTGNKRGTLYLSVVTDAGSSTLKEDQYTDSGVRRGSALALAGRAAIENARQPSDASGPTDSSHEAAPTVRDRLAEVKELLDQGAISEEEYQTARSRIIGDI